MKPIAQTTEPIQSTADLATANETTSIVYRRLDPTLRREINIAIIDPRAISLRAVHRKFQLDQSGINYHAFYRYARRIRAEAVLIEMSAATPSQDGDAQRLLPRVLAQRLLEALAYKNPSPRQIQRLAEAYRASVAALINLRRAGLLPTQPKDKKDGKPHPLTPADANDELAAILREYGQLVVREAKLNTQIDAAARRNRTDPAAEKGESNARRTKNPARGSRARKSIDQSDADTRSGSTR